MELRSATALVTGAGSRLGRALVAQLADAGAQVVAADRSAADLAELAERHPAVQTLCTDLAARADVLRLGDELGDVDVLVTTSREELAHDVVGTVGVVRRFLPGMVARDRGHVVLVAPRLEAVEPRTIEASLATFALLGGYAAGLRRELASRNVAVSVVRPLASIDAVASVVRRELDGHRAGRIVHAHCLDHRR